MQFQRYSSIENSYQTRVVNNILELGLSGGDWSVTEKIHGCNLSFSVEEGNIQVGKRNGFLQPGENFYNCRSVVETLLTKISAVHQMCCAQSVVVYGELFGGHYPHPDVAPVERIVAVQKEIFYSPHLDFSAFDISVNGVYLGVDEANRILSAAGLRHAKPLFEGSFHECMTYSNEFQTRVPDEEGLPQIEGNLCEGVVIRPKNTRNLPSGERIILKNKNAKWKEKDADSSMPAMPKDAIILPPEGDAYAAEFVKYLNKNRLMAAISKIGRVTSKDFSVVLSELMKDASIDFNKDYPDLVKTIEGLSDKHRKILKKRIGTVASYVVRESFLDIIDS